MPSLSGRYAASRSSAISQAPRQHAQAAQLQSNLQAQPLDASRFQCAARADGPSKAQDGGAQLNKGQTPPTSPFSQATVHREVGTSQVDSNELTQENVDRVLNEIRGYLFADGGDIEVVEVEEGKVFVRFQGNCASCGSQETTMAMGVERSLKAAFGDSLKEIVRMDPPEVKQPAGASVQSINSLLDLLRPAIESYGGSVTAQSVEGGVCTVQYEGPDAIWNGVRSAIKDRFEDVSEVQRAQRS